MKATTLQNRIDANLRTKGGAIAKKYANVEKVLLGDRYHGTGYSGSGRYVSCKNGDHFSVLQGLRLIGVDFVEGNDAPRGGWSGQYVELSPKGKRQVAEWAKIRRAEIAKAEADRKAAIEAKREAIKQQLEIINNNRDRVSAVFTETPNFSEPCKGYRFLIGKTTRSKVHFLASQLHVINSDEFRDALNFYFFGNDYHAGWDGERINYDDVK